MGTYSTERSWLYISPFHFFLLEYHSLPSCYLHLLPFSLFKIWHQNRTQTGTSYFMTALSLSLQKAVRIPFSTPLLVNVVLYCHHHTAVIICMFGHWESALPPPPPPQPSWLTGLPYSATIHLLWSSCWHCPPAPSLSTCSVIVPLLCCSALSSSLLVSPALSLSHHHCPACHLHSALSLSCSSSFLHCLFVLLVIFTLLCRCPACHRFCTVVVLLVIVSALLLSCLSSSFCSVIVLLCHHSALSLSSCYVTHPPPTKTPAMSSPSSFSVSNLFSYCVKNPFVQQETSPPFGKWSLEAMQHGILLLTFQPVCKCRFTQ